MAIAGRTARPPPNVRGTGAYMVSSKGCDPCDSPTTAGVLTDLEEGLVGEMVVIDARLDAAEVTLSGFDSAETERSQAHL